MILKVKDTERYDDRDDIKTNLLDSYNRLTDFIKKHLNDKFYIEDDQRINIRDVIARELCANLLIHREYSTGFFKEIGLADELGSGIKKIAKYTKIYSGGEPLFKDDEIFTASIPLTNITSGASFISSTKLKELILEYIKSSESGRTRQEINDYIYPLMNDNPENKNNRVRTSLTYLRTKDLIKNIGSDTKPIWITK